MPAAPASTASIRSNRTPLPTRVSQPRGVRDAAPVAGVAAASVFLTISAPSLGLYSRISQHNGCFRTSSHDRRVRTLAGQPSLLVAPGSINLESTFRSTHGAKLAGNAEP